MQQDLLLLWLLLWLLLLLLMMMMNGIAILLSLPTQVYTPDGECLASHSGYSQMLGIKTVAWSPSGQLLALGDYEQVGLGGGGGGGAKCGGVASVGQARREGRWTAGCHQNQGQQVFRAVHLVAACCLPPVSPGALCQPAQRMTRCTRLPPRCLQGATVLNHVTWSPLAQWGHPGVVRGPPSVVAYSEVVEDAARGVVAVSGAAHGGGRERRGEPGKGWCMQQVEVHCEGTTF